MFFVNSTKASNALESLVKPRNMNVSKDFLSKSASKHSLNYEEEYVKKKKVERQTLDDSSQNNSKIHSLSLNIEATRTLNCESNNNKSKKRKQKSVNKNISGDLSKQLENIEDFNCESEGIDHFSKNSLKNVDFEKIESNSNSHKMKKKRKRETSVCEDDSLMSKKSDIETRAINKRTFSDSSVRDKNAFEDNGDSNYMAKKKKKLKNKLKNVEKHSKLGEISCDGEFKSFKNSYDLSTKQNNQSEISNISLNTSNSPIKKKNKNKLKNIEKSPQLDEFSVKEVTVNSEATYDLLAKKRNLFQNKAYQKLQAAKFRYLNEMLYTNSGEDSLTYFQQNSDEFLDYHAGYQSQVSKWPINPVDIIIQELSQINKKAVIADLGCGEAKIAEVFPKRTVHSFDLIALKDCVTACDMANVPLPSNSVDVVIFCLSLMGTNWKDYLKEAQRILKLGGIMKIAEIESRIENVKHFIKEIENFGFSLINQDLSHKMFVFLNFKRISRSKKSSKIPEVTLKPCLYKKR